MNFTKIKKIYELVNQNIKKIFSKKFTKRDLIIYSPSLFLVLAGISIILSATLFKICISFFLVTFGILTFKAVKRIDATKNNLLSMIGQIDGQLLIHKHKMNLDNEDDDLINSLDDSKKVIFH